MNKFVIHTTLLLLSKLVLVYSIFMFLRGHNEPGGGFIGGLLLSLSMILHFLAIPDGKMKLFIQNQFLKIVSWCIFGLILVAVAPLFLGGGLLQGLWTTIPLPLAGKFSSILVFDFLIFIIVAVTTANTFICFQSASEENQ